jgi:hypothetical protein
MKKLEGEKKKIKTEKIMKKERIEKFFKNNNETNQNGRGRKYKIFT